jgi:hypothetical protein
VNEGEQYVAKWGEVQGLPWPPHPRDVFRELVEDYGRDDWQWDAVALEMAEYWTVGQVVEAFEGNPQILPGDLCLRLGLPMGSTYGDAVDKIREITAGSSAQADQVEGGDAIE